DHHRIHQDAGHTHRARRQRADLYGSPHLDDHLAARVVGGEGGGVDIDVGWLLLETDVAVCISEGATDQGDVDGERLVAQQLAAIDAHHLGQIGPGGPVHTSALDARVYEGAEADVGEEAGPSGADLAEELHGDAARQHVGLDLLLLRERLHARRPYPVA